MRYAVVFEQTDTGYSVYVPDLPGCISTGSSREQARRSIQEAIRGHLNVMREYGDPIPEPSTVAEMVDIYRAAEPPL